jgi:hypothetical protein
MEFDPEIYKIIFAWTVAYAILEPFMALLNYGLFNAFGTKTMFQLYYPTSPFLIVVCEYIFMTIVLIKSMYVYKKAFAKPTYYPRKNNWEDWRDFIISFMIVQLFIDALWTLFVNQASIHFKFLTFLDNYSHKLGLYSLIRPVIFGLSLLFITELNLRYLGDIEAVGAIFGSMFLITIASY